MHIDYRLLYQTEYSSPAGWWRDKSRGVEPPIGIPGSVLRQPSDLFKNAYDADFVRNVSDSFAFSALIS